MILNRMEDLQENQAFYDLFKKGIVENQNEYYIRISSKHDYEKDYHQISDIKEIKFYHKYMIFHLNNNDSHLFRYDDIEEFHLTYMHGVKVKC